MQMECILCFICVLLLANPAWTAEPEAKYKAEIVRLLSYLENSGCKFQRNDSWYSSSKAADHLRGKYNYLVRKDLVPDTEAFIDRAASQSSRSNQAYQVQCGNSQPVPSGQWLREELARYRSSH